MTTTDTILSNALNAAADVAEVMHGKEIANQYRKFAAQKYPDAPIDEAALRQAMESTKHLDEEN